MYAKVPFFLTVPFILIMLLRKAFNKEDLPAPIAPTIPTNSFGLISMLIFFSTCTILLSSLKSNCLSLPEVSMINLFNF